MKCTITSAYRLRDKTISSYHSFPVFSSNIEETASRQITFLKQFDDFSLELKLAKNSS